MEQGHVDGRGGTADRGAGIADVPQLTGELAALGGQPTEVAESDRRVAARETQVPGEVTQQPVGDAGRQSPNVFFGRLDHGAETGCATAYLLPRRAINTQCDRMLAGEPPHRPGQIGVSEQVFVSAVCFDVDADGVVRAEVVGPRQGERDQADVLDTNVESGGDLVEQVLRGRRVQFGRRASCGGIGVSCRVDVRQCGRHGRDATPLLGVCPHLVGVRVVGQ